MGQAEKLMACVADMDTILEETRFRCPVRVSAMGRHRPLSEFFDE